MHNFEIASVKSNIKAALNLSSRQVILLEYWLRNLFAEKLAIGKRAKLMLARVINKTKQVDKVILVICTVAFLFVGILIKPFESMIF